VPEVTAEAPLRWRTVRRSDHLGRGRDYAHAHAWKACVTGQAWLNGWCTDFEAIVQLITRELETALAPDANDADVHRILAALKLNFNEHDKAVYHQERALSLNPNSDLIVVQQGELLTWLGRPNEGIDWIRRAMRLNPAAFLESSRARALRGAQLRRCD
jgi:adenylate cyclase